MGWFIWLNCLEPFSTRNIKTTVLRSKVKTWVFLYFTKHRLSFHSLFLYILIFYQAPSFFFSFGNPTPTSNRLHIKIRCKQLSTHSDRCNSNTPPLSLATLSFYSWLMVICCFSTHYVSLERDVFTTSRVFVPVRCLRISLHKNENSVIIYSPSCWYSTQKVCRAS